MTVSCGAKSAVEPRARFPRWSPSPWTLVLLGLVSNWSFGSSLLNETAEPSEDPTAVLPAPGCCSCLA